MTSGDSATSATSKTARGTLCTLCAAILSLDVGFGRARQARKRAVPLAKSTSLHCTTAYRGSMDSDAGEQGSAYSAYIAAVTKLPDAPCRARTGVRIAFVGVAGGRGLRGHPEICSVRRVVRDGRDDGGAGGV